MAVTAKDFLDAKEIAFIGFSGNEKSFSRGVYADFVASGMKVYPVNLRSFTEGDIKVYGSVGEIANPPDKAYALINKENAKKLVASLVGSPVRKLWLQDADEELLESCHKAGIETFVGCPRMYLSKGFMHRVHGFFAGAKR